MKKTHPPTLARNDFQSIGITLIAGCSLLISSCSKPDLELNEVSPSGSAIENYYHNITLKQAEKRALEAITQFSPTSTKSVERRIKSGEVVLDRSVTRSGGEASATDTLFYVVNFEDNQGYVVLAADSRTVDVLVVSDEGNMDWQNPGNSTQQYLNNVLVEYQRSAIGCINGGGGIGGGTGGGGIWPPSGDILDGGKRTSPVFTFDYDPWMKNYANRVPPMVKTKWDQGYPYNQRMPLIQGSPACLGCTALAIAQVMAYKQHPKTYGGHTFDFNAMYDCNEYYPNEDIISFVTMAHESFPTTSVLYFKEGTVIHPANIKTVLEKMGYSSSEYIPGYDYAAILKSLKNDCPTTITGFELDTEFSMAHTWVIDGHLEYSRNYVKHISGYYRSGTWIAPADIPGTEYRRYFHYNLGWNGDKDGYFFAGVFDTDNGQGNNETTIGNGLGVINAPMLKSNGSNDYRNRIKMWVNIEP